MKRRITAIIVSIAIVGMCQGLIIPLLALLLERRGVSALFNGVSTTALFLGVIVASPFIERTVRRIGAKKTILGSTLLSILLTLSFTVTGNIYVWLAIRLLLGVALAGLFVASEIWLNRLVAQSGNRGQVFAFYGLAIALGMLIGPQGMNMLEVSEKLPFFFSVASFLIPLLIMWRIPEDGSELDPVEQGGERGAKRWLRIYLLAPFAMCASLVYGYMDGALVGSFPIYGARIGMTNGEISFALTVFVFGSIVFQFPLGYLSDKWSRRNTLILATLVGMTGFLVLPWFGDSRFGLLASLFFAGGALGSFYSLGLAYLGDLMELSDLATGNVLYTMMYGVGSLIGPSLTGSLISWLGKDLFAWSIAGMLLGYALFGFASLRKAKQSSPLLTQRGRGV